MTEMTAIRYVVADRPAKSRMLDELCANTGWHRNHARKALKAALGPKVVAPRRSPRPPVYGPEVIPALTACWLVLGMPAGKRLAPMLNEIVAVLRHFRELVIDDDTAALLASMSAATIDRRLAGERAKRQIKGHRATKPGSLLRSQIPIRTWADWDDAKPGFVEIDLVSHDGGNTIGPFAFTLTVTDVATGWTENRSVPSKEAKCVLRALESIAATMPFPILGVDSDNGAEFINVYLFLWCKNHEITFTRARATNKNDGCHVEQKNWAVVRTVVGYHRYDTAPELLLLNEIWQLQSQLTNYFYPQQKLISKVRNGATVTKKYDTATTPFHRAINHPDTTADRKAALARTHALINPAATQRQIQALTAQLHKMTTSKSQPATRARVPKRAQSHEATKPPSRAS
ncbi:integrase core domain protein [Mycobacterium avium MAV_120809_2495]|nr:integrase core domain protein [Mycobacterium avium MAV_120809_2495]